MISSFVAGLNWFGLILKKPSKKLLINTVNKKLSNNFEIGSGQHGQSCFPAPTNIKPDPSGQSIFKNTAQINTHECEDQPHCSNQHEPSHNIPTEEHPAENYTQDKEYEELNFGMGPDQEILE